MTAWGDVVEPVAPSYGVGSVSDASGHRRFGGAGAVELLVATRVQPSYQQVRTPVGRANGVWPSAGRVLANLTSILGV